MDYNNAASIPEWMLQTLNAGQGAGQAFNNAANDAAMRRQERAQNPLGNLNLNHQADVSDVAAGINNGMGAINDWTFLRFLGNSAPEHYARGQANTQNAEALRNILMQRMQRGQSLPPGLLDQ